MTPGIKYWTSTCPCQRLSYVPEAVICASVSRYSDVASIWRWPHSLSPTARPPVSTVDKTAQQHAITKPPTAELYIPHTYSRYTCMYYRSVLYAELYIHTTGAYTYYYILYCIYTRYILYYIHTLHTILYIHTLHTILYIRTYVVICRYYTLYREFIHQYTT